MKRNEQMTAALLVAALAAFGCSKTDKTPQTQTQSQHTEQTTQAIPVSITNDTTGDKGLNTTATKIVGPVSFADGEAA